LRDSCTSEEFVERVDHAIDPFVAVLDAAAFTPEVGDPAKARRSQYGFGGNLKREGGLASKPIDPSGTPKSQCWGHLRTHTENISQMQTQCTV
jgi:hypothetical protein